MVGIISISSSLTTTILDEDGTSVSFFLSFIDKEGQPFFDLGGISSNASVASTKCFHLLSCAIACASVYTMKQFKHNSFMYYRIYWYELPVSLIEIEHLASGRPCALF